MAKGGVLCVLDLDLGLFLVKRVIESEQKNN